MFTHAAVCVLHVGIMSYMYACDCECKHSLHTGKCWCLRNVVCVTFGYSRAWPYLLDHSSCLPIQSTRV